MNKGDIILIPFPFTDLSGNKLRPTIVLAELPHDFIVCFITSQTQWQEATDVLLTPSATNGLKLPSLIRTNKIATIQKALVIGTIGQLDTTAVASLNKNLKIVLQLS